MRFTLTCKENPNTGELGWLDSRITCDAYDSSAYGLGLAHDILEHAAFDTVADEIEAHGAMYRIRYEGGWCNPWNFNVLDMDAFALEWVSLIGGLGNESCLRTPPKTRPLSDEIEEDISTIIEKGKGFVASEFGNDIFSNEEAKRIEEVFRAYFRIGYRKVGKRFKGLMSCEIAALFDSLTKEFEKFKPENEGQEIKVTVNLKAQRVSIEEVIHEYY